MIFTKDEAKLIARGAKTMLLANVTLDRLTGRPRPSWCQRFKVGEDISIQPAANAPEVCRVLITSRELTTLGDLDFYAARALGYRTQADMARDLLDRFDPEWPPLQPAICDVCEGFAEIDGQPCPNSECDFGEVQIPATVEDDAALEWFRSRHAAREMWAVRFELAPDGLRFLSGKVIAGKQGDYVESSARGLRGEPPAVDELTQRRLTHEAHLDDQARQEARLERQVTDNITAAGGNPSDQRSRSAMRSAMLIARRRNAERSAA